MSTVNILKHLKQVQYHPSLCNYRLNKQAPLLFIHCSKCFNLQTGQVRFYQRPPQKTGLLSKFIDNIKDGLKRDKQLQDNLQKFQNEAKKVEESQALKDAKAKFSVFGQIKETVSPITSKLEESVKETSKTASSTIGKIYKDAVESDVFKKGQEVSEELGKSAREAASKLSKQQEELEKTDTYKTASEALSKVKEDLFDDIAKESRPYQRPDKLKRRTQPTQKKEVSFEANEDAQDVVLHKDSKWQQQWKDFRDNNAVVTGLFTLKTKYDESDNVVIRASRVVTDKLTDVFSDVFSQSEQAQTLAEISKIDASFNKDEFIKECEFEIIPTVLEAYLRGDLDILQDWCHEGAFNVLSTQIKHNESIGLVNASRILDIRDVELVLAKIMDQGPVLIMTFQAQQVNMTKNKRGEIVEGSVDNIENINYVWAMCRDQAIFDHKQAWRVLEFGIQQATPYL